MGKNYYGQFESILQMSMKLHKIGTQDGSVQPQVEWTFNRNFTVFLSLLLCYHHHHHHCDDDDYDITLPLLHSSLAGF
jgi:hypothetical protein